MHLDGFETQEEQQAPATKTAGPGVDALHQENRQKT
jgi:hypothetical protein